MPDASYEQSDRTSDIKLSMQRNHFSGTIETVERGFTRVIVCSGFLTALGDSGGGFVEIVNTESELGVYIYVEYDKREDRKS